MGLFQEAAIFVGRHITAPIRRSNIERSTGQKQVICEFISVTTKEGHTFDTGLGNESLYLAGNVARRVYSWEIWDAKTLKKSSL